MNSWYQLAIEGLILYVLIMLGICMCIKVMIDKKKKQKNKKTIAGLLLTIISMSIFAVFLFTRSTYYKYNDSMILQNNILKVKEKYGEFDIGEYQKGKAGRVGYYIYTDNGPIMPDHLKHYYYIEYDMWGVVTKVYDACQPGD